MMTTSFVMVLFSACTEEQHPAPVAGFSFSVGQNGSVMFLNNSLNADDYMWSFGDGGTSVERSPQYKYRTNETFVVTLVATGPGGSATFSNTVTISNVTSSLTYINKSFTPITITVGNETRVIPPGDNVYFVGEPNTLVNVSAFTSGKTTSGTQVGLKLNWSFTSMFPVTENTDSDLNVSSDWFFLKVKNISAYPITKVYVNYGLLNQTIDDIIIPNDGETYNIGYYKAFLNSNVRLESSAGYWYSNTDLPFTTNQSFNFGAQ